MHVMYYTVLRITMHFVVWHVSTTDTCCQMHSAESTIEARIIGLQDIKQAVVGQIINENNSGSSFSNEGSGTGTEDRSKMPTPGGLGAVLWTSVRASVTDGPIHSIPSELSRVTANSAEVRIYSTLNSTEKLYTKNFGPLTPSELLNFSYFLVWFSGSG